MTLALRYSARSHVGLVRTGNEDSGYAGPSMLVVADGMGGHAAGELASAAAVAAFATIDATSDHDDETDVLSDLASGVSRTTDTIRGVVGERPQLAGMGTTLTALAWRQGLMNVAHVGDSRAYLLRDGELQRMTHDHTYVQMLVDTGRITADEALTHARRNLLLRAIDGVNDVEPDLQTREARVGDRYLVCSDGLCGVVPEAELARLLGEGDPTYAVAALVDAALELGAPDNVTVVVADVVDLAGDIAEAVEELTPVVVGAASEPRNREQLSNVSFPDDVEPELGAAVSAPTVPIDLPRAPSPHRQARSWRGWWPVAAVLAVLAAIMLAASALYSWGTSQFYVGASDGFVAIYQGVPQSIAGRSLSRVVEPSTVAVAALPELDASAVLGSIPATSLDDARRTVARLQSQATACAATPTPVGCPVPVPAPSPSPSPSPTPVATAVATPSPDGATPAPRPSP